MIVFGWNSLSIQKEEMFKLRSELKGSAKMQHGAGVLRAGQEELPCEDLKRPVQLKGARERGR